MCESEAPDPAREQMRYALQMIHDTFDGGLRSGLRNRDQQFAYDMACHGLGLTRGTIPVEMPDMPTDAMIAAGGKAYLASVPELPLESAKQIYLAMQAVAVHAALKDGGAEVTSRQAADASPDR
jgi:hypothetical protein